MKGEERRAYRLSQVERLLAKKHGSSPLAMYLSDMFWTADEGRRVYHDSSPLLEKDVQQSMTKEEKSRLRLILEVAGLCHDLSLHFKFDLKEAFGVRNDFRVRNKQLMEWLSNTPYEHIAVYTAYIMKKQAIFLYQNIRYAPAQDELAELYSSEHQTTVGNPLNTAIPPRDYVKLITDALLQIDRHWQRGRRLKLDPELIILHDEIYGVVPLRFDKTVLQLARELFDYMDSELQGRLLQEGYDTNIEWWENQPEKAKLALAELMGQYSNKVRALRAKYLAEGWLTDHSLSFSYLLFHAECCAKGWWREEDTAL